jgi:3-deoxy-manno-octulosonate cytidylyltransferase (CMP-KDO synthetase)
MRTVCVIPARMASSRFPGKPLVPLLGLPLVLHVWERCRLAKRLDRVVVATCDRAIAEAVEARGGEAVMTADSHPGAVDRTAEAVTKLGITLEPDDLVLMAQGDEVVVGPEMLDEMVAAYAASRAPVVNLACAIGDPADHDDLNVVKVCAALDGKALFFSRSPIPSRRRAGAIDPLPLWQQTGIIAFSRAFLDTFGRLARTPLEQIEQIDMLRTLEHGYPIQLVFTPNRLQGVDVPGDIAKGERLLAADPVTPRYLSPGK